MLDLHLCHNWINIYSTHLLFVIESLNFPLIIKLKWTVYVMSYYKKDIILLDISYSKY